MIQDFSSVFVGKQAVRVKAVSLRDHSMLRNVVGMVVTLALVSGVVSCMVFGWLIKSGLSELEAKQSVKIELIKEQQKLYERRNVMSARDRVEIAAAGLGLYAPEKGQTLHL